MRFLLDSFFNSSWFLIIVLIVAMALLLLSSFTRRKKEEQYRDDLASHIVKGAKIKTYTGIYGTVVSVRNTTDGKVVLIETGEGDKVSYQQIHINAIYGLDESEDMVIDAEGNEVPMSALNVDKETEGQKEESVETEEKPKKTKKTTKENE
jgi:preprotein translocase YajC subunit